MAEITIEFTGRIQDLNEVSSALFETESFGTGTQKEIPGGGKLTMQSMMLRKAYGIPQYIEVVLSIGGSVAAGIASNYIYVKLIEHQGGNLSIRINRREVHLDKRKITKMIEEQIAIHERNLRDESGGPAR
jgi:hypothetical protein